MARLLNTTRAKKLAVIHSYTNSQQLFTPKEIHLSIRHHGYSTSFALCNHTHRLHEYRFTLASELYKTGVHILSGSSLMFGFAQLHGSGLNIPHSLRLTWVYPGFHIIFIFAH